MDGYERGKKKEEVDVFKREGWEWKGWICVRLKKVQKSDECLGMEGGMKRTNCMGGERSRWL